MNGQRPGIAAAVLMALLSLTACQPRSTAGDRVLASSTDLIVELDQNQAISDATYLLHFRTGPSGGLQAGDTITVAAPIGTDFSDDSLGWTVEADCAPVAIASVDVQSSETEQSLNTFVVQLGSAIPAETPVTMVVRWITNPGPGTALHLSLGTSSEPEPRISNAYDIVGTGRMAWHTWEDPGIAPTPCLGHSTGTTDCNIRSYMVYDPDGSARPGRGLLVDLHGCFYTAATEARWSSFHQVVNPADFVLMFPQQSLEANGGRCWNWFDPDHQRRGAGEPGLIAGMVRQVMQDYQIDPERVFITGISAGGVMSSIMLVTYPDLFAAGVVAAGCQYQGLPCFGAPSVQPPAAAAQAAVDEMGAYLRSVPVFAVTGDLDEVVPPPNAEFLVQQWIAINAIRRTGQPNLVPVLPTESRMESPPSVKDYTVDIWRDENGCLLAQRWTIHGMAHQWSGAESNGSPIDVVVTDPQGPALNEAIVDFFLDHPRSASCP